MGVVYRGVRMKLDRPVAIKVLHLALPAEMKARERFEREAQMMARLDHPHCVSIIDYGLHDQKPFVVMELVRGQSLHDMLAEQGRFEALRAVDIMRQILSGLSHAHEQGIIHRDIKPANIMITPKAPLGLHVRILDFGLARMVAGGDSSLSSDVAVGTPSYMAPEQCRGEKADAQADIYACGVVLFEMLTGVKPLTSADPLVTIRMQTDQAPPKLTDLAPGGNFGVLEDIVAKALAKAPGDRYRSAAAMSEALDAALRGRNAPESTAVIPKAKLAATDTPTLIPVTSVAKRPERQDRNDRHDRPIVRPVAPSRPILGVFFALLVVAGAVGASLADDIVWQMPAPVAVAPPPAPVTPAPQPAPAPAPVPPPPTIETVADPAGGMVLAAKQLATGGHVDRAIDLLTAGHAIYPDRADLPLLAGKLYFSKFWWNDGIASFREAIKLDASLKDDAEVIAAAVHGFLTTPDWDPRIAQFITELGPAALAALDDAAKAQKVPALRGRATALANRMRNH